MHLSGLIFWLLLALCLSAVWFYLFSIYAALDLFSRPCKVAPDFHPPISILKPIRGLDESAYENLASFCRQDYPTFQIIFGVMDDEDPALTVVEQIIRDFPLADISVVSSSNTIGANLKVSNLANMESRAKYPLLLISDSDIRVGRDYLIRVVQPLRDPENGVVTCMYRSRLLGWAASIEALGISTEFHAGVMAARKLEGMYFALGSTILIRHEALKAIGGFPSIADFLADDFLLGYLPAHAGYKVVLSDYVVEHVLGTETFHDLFKHQTRWSRSTRISRPWGYIGLVFTHGTVSSLLLLLASRGSAAGWIVLAVTWSVRLATGWLIGGRLLKDPVARKLLWLVPIRDIISFALWVYSFIGNTIEWRGQRFKLTRAGKLVPLNTNADD
ncbi:MAG TPA: bacteriohopanetetrol glucosamine biosynthesis glycosyltransferase HpnI [Blastocatellia bacterium]|nr:bacteriohopanetetrol glucosamine biosynthesis glycosyltransferase HpnI [Blastocatellia bacterium]